VGAGDLLREIDRRLLPPLARGLGRLARSGPARHLRRPRPLTAAALASAAAVTAVGVWTAADQAPQPPAGDLTRVGVLGGQSIPGYVAASRSKLAQLVARGTTGRAYALVSFAAYLPPVSLARALAGAEVAQVHIRVPLPEGESEMERIPVARVPADVVAGMAALAEQKDSEAADYRSLSAKLTGDGAEERRLRAAYTRGARLAAAEAAAYRSGCSCVYAAVVRGAPAVLERVADRPTVLAVDPVPEVRRLDEAVFLPPLPEQTSAGPPTTRPAVTTPHTVRREEPVSPDRSSGPPASGTTTVVPPSRVASSAASASSPPSPSSSPTAPSSPSPSGR
jgi:hypothetical protein